MSVDEPFGRQPKPVTVVIHGEREDTQMWLRDLMRLAEFKGDMVQVQTVRDMNTTSFKIYPRAVND